MKGSEFDVKPPACFLCGNSINLKKVFKVFNSGARKIPNRSRFSMYNKC